MNSRIGSSSTTATNMPISQYGCALETGRAFRIRQTWLAAGAAAVLLLDIAPANSQFPAVGGWGLAEMASEQPTEIVGILIAGP